MKTFLQSLFFFLLVTQICVAQWEQTNGPYGEFVLSLAISGDNIYAGTVNGAFYSTNNGENWTTINLNNIGVNSFAFNHSEDIFAGTRYGYIFRSTDDGENWVNVFTGGRTRSGPLLII